MRTINVGKFRCFCWWVAAAEFVSPDDSHSPPSHVTYSETSLDVMHIRANDADNKINVGKFRCFCWWVAAAEFVHPDESHSPPSHVTFPNQS